ncbi:MAG TPA: DUF4926 domain-containing protein [Anaerolineales bacterium]|nr:DUF4926 domain-containing protein [Anaerolineales bacterium]
MIKELDTVVLAKDLNGYRLKRGDVGAVVHVYEENKAFEIEFVTGEGETVAVATLSAEDVRPMRRADILHVRTYATA